MTDTIEQLCPHCANLTVTEMSFNEQLKTENAELASELDAAKKALEDEKTEAWTSDVAYSALKSELEGKERAVKYYAGEFERTKEKLLATQEGVNVDFLLDAVDHIYDELGLDAEVPVWQNRVKAVKAYKQPNTAKAAAMLELGQLTAKLCNPILENLKYKGVQLDDYCGDMSIPLLKAVKTMNEKLEALRATEGQAESGGG